MLGNSASSIAINKISSTTSKQKDSVLKSAQTTTAAITNNKRPEPKPRRMEGGLNNGSDIQIDEETWKDWKDSRVPLIFRLKSTVRTEKGNPSSQNIPSISMIGVSGNTVNEELESDSNGNVLINRIKQLRRVAAPKLPTDNNAELYSVNTDINKDLMQASVYRRLKNNGNSNVLNSSFSASDSSSSSSPYLASVTATCDSNSGVVEINSIDSSLTNTNAIESSPPLPTKPFLDFQKDVNTSRSKDSLNILSSKSSENNSLIVNRFSTKSNTVGGKDIISGSEIPRARQLVTQKVIFELLNAL